MAVAPKESLALDLNAYRRSTSRRIAVTGHTIDATDVFFAYWRFAAERQNIFYRRLGASDKTILTLDPVLNRYKFTNAYRASDRVSQYLIRQVVYRDDLPADEQNVFFRVLLFKIFNKIETWEFLQKTFGELNWKRFDSQRFDQALSRRMAEGERIYSAAYIMPSGRSAFGSRSKHENHLKLIELLMKERYFARIANCRSMAEAFNLLLAAPSIGPFLAYQFAIDLNYTDLTNFSESEFVVAGPGALDGISKCFANAGDVAPADVIRYMHDNQAQHFAEQGISFADLWGRPLQLIDCQNLFCEISKYARVAFPQYSGAAGRTRIKQKFSSRKPLPDPWYPPKWGLNPKISEHFKRPEPWGRPAQLLCT